MIAFLHSSCFWLVICLVIFAIAFLWISMKLTEPPREDEPSWEQRLAEIKPPPRPVIKRDDNNNHDELFATLFVICILAHIAFIYRKNRN